MLLDLHVFVLDHLILDLGENLEVKVVCAFQLFQRAYVGNSPIIRQEFALYNCAVQVKGKRIAKTRLVKSISEDGARLLWSLFCMRMILSMHSTRLYSFTMAIRVFFLKMPLFPITLYQRNTQNALCCLSDV